MRIVLVSVEVDTTSSAGNLQRLIRAIDHSAASSPPPDLLVLPGACGASAGAAVAAGTLTAIKETIAAKAREWGVYIAIGLNRLDGNTTMPWLALFDHDGDILNVDDDQTRNNEPDTFLAGCTMATPVGRLIIADPFSIEPDFLAQKADANAIVVVPWSASVPNTKRKAWSIFFTKLKEGKQASGPLYWAVSATARKASDYNDDFHLASMLIARDGKILGQAKLGEPGMLALDVELPVPVSHTINEG